MADLTSIEKKIAELTKKREQLIETQTKHLINALKKKLGEDFSVELIQAIIEVAWTKADSKMKEEIKTMASSFRHKRAKSDPKTNRKVRAPAQAA